MARGEQSAREEGLRKEKEKKRKRINHYKLKRCVLREARRSQRGGRRGQQERWGSKGWGSKRQGSKRQGSKKEPTGLAREGQCWIKKGNEWKKSNLV